MAGDVRKPPVGAVLRQHPQGVRGTCGWCGLPCADKTPGRGWLKWYHDACSLEMAIIERPDQARRSVLERDKGICCDCGEDWSQRFKAIPGPGSTPRHEMGPDGPRRIVAPSIRYEDNERIYFCAVTWVSLWHVDHKIPLWKVRHMPDLQRLEYFKLPNLITRCHECHKFKTEDEAAERAKIKKRDRKPKAKRSWSSRPLDKRPSSAGNGFPPRGSTPMRRKR